jgi:hypothetical protein
MINNNINPTSYQWDNNPDILKQVYAKNSQSRKVAFWGLISVYINLITFFLLLFSGINTYTLTFLIPGTLSGIYTFYFSCKNGINSINKVIGLITSLISLFLVAFPIVFAILTLLSS